MWPSPDGSRWRCDQPPIARLALTSPPGSVAPTTARFDASASSDPEGRPLTFTFTCGNGTKVGPQASAVATCSYPAGGSFKARVSVTDDAGNQANSPFTTLVIASNQPPVAVLTVTVAGKVATLNASGSSDPEHGALTYTYRCGNGAPDIGPTTSSSAQCTYSTSGTYTLRLTVTDAGGLSASTTTKLRI